MAGPATTYLVDLADPSNDAAAASPEATRLRSYLEDGDYVVQVVFDANVVADEIVFLLAIDADGDQDTFAVDETAHDIFCNRSSFTAEVNVIVDTIDGEALIDNGLDRAELDAPTFAGQRLTIVIPASYGLDADTTLAAVVANAEEPTDCVPGGAASF